MTHANKTFSLSQTTKERVPALPFLLLKEAILGKHYDLSIVFAGDRRTKTLNMTYRGKSYTPNVLSFPLDNNNGEIFINLREAKRQHKKRGESYEYFVALLVVHGMLHLKGLPHGSKMEQQEQTMLAKFGIRNMFTSR